MTIESYIERETCARLRGQGCLTPKMGHAGWPDRLVLTGAGRAFFIEFKQPRGKLRANQSIIRSDLERAGYHVLVVREVLDYPTVKAVVQAANAGRPVRLPD